ncbi:MAG: dTMP kinase [Propionibacteriaceae bacterium]|jgi:dTMP kinase|nr:dTMP kinase [Propionibacteriaceae bacterium]
MCDQDRDSSSAHARPAATPSSGPTIVADRAARHTGKLIALEGGDGSGKSTHARLLQQWLADRGFVVCSTFEPGDTPLGQTIRRLVLHGELPICPRAETLLYAADKAQHMEDVIVPALRAGQVVICDRYVDSAIAYQGAGRDIGADQVAQVNWWAVGDLRPDLTIVLDVPVDQGVGQMAELDRIESAGADFHRRVRQFFLDLAAADPQRYLVVDRRAGVDQVSAQITARVTQLLQE